MTALPDEQGNVRKKSAIRAKVLVIAEAVTLAHVGRAITVASILQQAGHDVVLACDPRYDRFLDVSFPWLAIESIASETFLAALARGRPVFTEQTLERYVQADRALFDKIAPTAVVGDFRLSLSVSARAAGVPYANVTNAYWSPYARPRFRIPTLSYVPGALAGVAEPVFRMVRPLAFAAHAEPMNRVRRAHGLPPFRRDVREVYCDGDVTLYADLPEVIPVFGAPSSHRYVGPVLWSPAMDLPPWWEEMVAGPPPIYVSLGSSGAAGVLDSVLEAVLPLERPVVVATAGRTPLPAARASVWAAEYVPGALVSAQACAVICNGGSPTTQQAHVHGVPVVGICSNLDQYLNMDYVQRIGAGRLLRADRASVDAIRDAARWAVDDRDARARAQKGPALAAAHRAQDALPAALAELLAAPDARARGDGG